MKNILHIDMNAYFASVEELLHPEFKNKPLIVGGRSKRSVVASANYIARAAGIKAAMPMYRAELICPNAIICIPTFGKYEEYHNKFINLIRKYFSENIETTSIDECYIDVTDISNDKSPLQIAMQIQNMIKSRIGLKCSIGIAHNKLLAKMASDYKKPFGITEMYKEDVIAKLWPLDIGEMYMIGTATAKYLKANGINTIGDLANARHNKLASILNKNWLDYYNAANGNSSDELDLTSSAPKSISADYTFLDITSNEREINSNINKYAQEVWTKLKQQKLESRTIRIGIKTLDRKVHLKSYSPGYKIKSYENFISLLKQTYEKYFYGKNIRMITIGLTNLSPKNQEFNLFDYIEQN